jgi:predicted PurR-regulated permease PerM
MTNPIKQFMDRHINYGMAFAGAGFLGVTVFVINYPHGVPMALVAAVKQAIYTFFAAGFITRNSERLAVKLNNRWLSLLLSIIVSTCIAVGLTYLVHSLRGTAQPLQSTIPTMITAPLAFIIVGWQAQRKAARSAAQQRNTG